MGQTEKTILPFSVIAGLYKNVLVSSEQEIDNTATPSTSLMQEKKIPVLVRSHESVIPPQQKNFLASIMTACKLQENEYITIAVDGKESVDYLTLKARYEARFVLLFGIEPSSIQLPIQFPYFQIQSFQGCQYLCAPSLELIEQDKSLKVQLWQCLKKIFP
jgi:hypothetical protein